MQDVFSDVKHFEIIDGIVAAVPDFILFKEAGRFLFFHLDVFDVGRFLNGGRCNQFRKIKVKHRGERGEHDDGRAILKILIPLAFIAVISLNFVRELKVINVASRIEGGNT